MALLYDRVEAGKRLAAALEGTVGKDGIVLAIPRGGLVVGYEVAKALDILLDVIIPRKMGAPGNSELAIGAMTEDGTIILDERLVKMLQVSKQYITEESERQTQEIERRLKLYRGDRPYPNLKDREVIIVDDGIATGSTMEAALLSVRRRGAKKIIVAVPVCPESTMKQLEKKADKVFCLFMPEPFYAIGQFYTLFDQTSDEEVKRLFKSSIKDKPKTEGTKNGKKES
jgi:predicted phosphoribosyltransferase